MRRTSILLATMLLALGLVALPSIADPDTLAVTDLTAPELDAAALAELLVADSTGDDVTIVPGSIAYTGAEAAAGAFLGGSNVIGFSDGVILSSGRADDVTGPNSSSSTTTAVGQPGDPQLSALAGYPTYDASVLEFQFEVPEGAEQVFFTYVFGSEEYTEYVGSTFNDVFAFWVNGQNCAVVGDGQPVSINTINHGNTARSFDPVNPALYVNNDPFDGSLATPPLEAATAPYNTEMDGFTVPLVCSAEVDPAATNTMRLAIADASDDVLDSWVLIQAGSLSITPPGDPDTFTVALEGFAASYEQGASQTGTETARFVYTDNDGSIEQVYNVFTIDGFTTLTDYQALFADVAYDPYIRGLHGEDPSHVVAPETRDVPLAFTLQPDAPVGSYTLRLTAFDVTGQDPTSVTLDAALAGAYGSPLDADSIEAAVVTLVVDHPAAPAVAARLLKDADVQPRYGRGQSGGNHIANVAHRMTEDHGTDFHGVPKSDAQRYECEVATFLRSGEVGPAAMVADAACGDHG
jgi:hypothetical protein